MGKKIYLSNKEIEYIKDLIWNESQNDLNEMNQEESEKILDKLMEKFDVN